MGICNTCGDGCDELAQLSVDDNDPGPTCQSCFNAEMKRRMESNLAAQKYHYVVTTWNEQRDKNFAEINDKLADSILLHLEDSYLDIGLDEAEESRKAFLSEISDLLPRSVNTEVLMMMLQNDASFSLLATFIARMAAKLPKDVVISELHESFDEWEMAYSIILRSKLAPIKDNKKVADRIIRGIKQRTVLASAHEASLLPSLMDSDGKLQDLI